MHAPIDHLEAELFVRALGDAAVDPGVGRHLDAAVAARPIFGGRDETRADAGPAVPFHHEPTFEVAHRLLRIAAVGVRAQVDLGEADDLPHRRLRDEDRERHRPRPLPRQELHELRRMLLDGRVRPQRLPQERQLDGWGHGGSFSSRARQTDPPLHRRRSTPRGSASLSLDWGKRRACHVWVQLRATYKTRMLYNK